MNLGLELIVKPLLLSASLGVAVAVLYLGMDWVRRRLTRR